jgi:hypothetical protein
VSFKRITRYRVRTDAFEFLRTFSPVSIIPGSLPAEKERKKERKNRPTVLVNTAAHLMEGGWYGVGVWYAWVEML